MMAAEVLAKFIGDNSSLVRAAEGSSKAIGKVDEAAKRASRGVSQSSKSVSTSVDGIGVGFKNALGTVLKFGAATGVVGLFAGAIAGAKSAFLDYNSALEQSSIGFTTMLGSATKAQALMKQLQDFAARTPFDFKGLVESSQKLLVMGYNAQELIPTLGTIGDAVAAMGGSMQDMGGRVIRAFQQMKAKGKVSAEEMMQLAEAGIPAWQYLADTIGTDVPTAMATAKKSGIDSTTAIKGILAGMQSDFGGMMEAQSKTLMGAWSTVLDYVQINVANATRPIYNKFRDMVLRISEILSGPEAAKIGEKFTKAMTTGFDLIITAVSPIVEKVGAALAQLVPLAIKIAALMKPAWIALGAGIMVAFKALEVFLDLIKGAASFFDHNSAAAKTLAAALTALLAVMVANKAISFFNSIKDGVQGMLASAKAATQAKAAFSTFSAGTALTNQTLANFSNANKDAIAGVNATKGAATGASVGIAGMAGSLVGAIGPQVALAAGMAVLGYQLQKSAQEAQEAAQRTAEYKDRIGELLSAGAKWRDFMSQSSTMGDKVHQSLTKQILGNKDLAKVMRETGLHATDFTRDITAGAGAMEAWDNISDNIGKSTLPRVVKALNEGKFNAKTFGDQWDVIKGQIQAAGMSVEQFKGSEFAKHIAEVAKSSGMSADQIDRLTENLDEEADAFQKAYPAAKQMTDEQKRLNKETEQAKKVASMYGKELIDFTQPAAQAKGVMEQMDKATEKMMDDITENLTNTANPFEVFSEKSQTSLKDMMSNLDKNLGYIVGWQKNLQTALGKGLDPGVYTYLIQQGPEKFGRAVADLAKATPEQVAGFNAKMGQYLNLDGVAEKLTAQADAVGQILGSHDYGTTRLKKDFPEKWKEIINSLPPNIKAALDANDASIKKAFSASVLGAIGQAQKIAKVNKYEVDVKANPGSVTRMNQDFQGFIDKVPDLDVMVGMNPKDAQTQLANWIVGVGKTPANVPIKGVTKEASDQIHAFIGEIEKLDPSIDFNGDPKEAQKKLAEVLALIGKSEGDVGLSANDKKARDILNKQLALIRASKADLQMGANNSIAYTQLRSIENAVARTHANIQVGANTAMAIVAANGTVAQIQRMKANIQVGAQLAGQHTAGMQLNAEGSILEFYRKGGFKTDFGLHGERHEAQLAPAGAWRIWAEPETGGEAYIPLAQAKRPRSINLLAEVADRFGYILTRQMKSGGIINGNSIAHRMPSSRHSTHINTELNVTMSTGDVMAEGGFKKRMLAELQYALEEHDKQLAKRLGAR